MLAAEGARQKLAVEIARSFICCPSLVYVPFAHCTVE